MSDLTNKLTFLASRDTKEITNPFAEDEDSTSIKEDDVDEELLSISIDRYLKKSNKSKKEKKIKNKKSLFKDLDDIDKYMDIEDNKSFGSEVASLFNQLNEMDMIDASDDFDSYLENGFEDDENIELRNSLISLGRKYARDTATSAEENEIQQAYLPNEKKLKELYDEIDIDKNSLQKDIEQMRLSRSRNFKVLSELTETKNSFTNTQLSIIKEINSMKKHQFDLKYKELKLNPQVENTDELSNNTIKALFGMGKADMINSLGGYSEISGGNIDGDDVESYDDEYLHSKYIENQNLDSNESDYNDKYVEYEGLDVSYILIVNEEDESILNAFAEDSEGNLLTDYPMPSNIASLDFNMDFKTMTATDNYYREYKIRYV